MPLNYWLPRAVKSSLLTCARQTLGLQPVRNVQVTLCSVLSSYLLLVVLDKEDILQIIIKLIIVSEFTYLINYTLDSWFEHASKEWSFYLG